MAWPSESAEKLRCTWLVSLTKCHCRSNQRTWLILRFDMERS